MISVYWGLFILFDSVTHWTVIEGLGIDPTPDNKKHGAWASNLWRVIAFISIGVLSDVREIGWLFYGAMAYSMFLGGFGELLNLWRGKEFGYLGKGPTDLRLAKIGSPVKRLILFTTLSAIYIYLYYAFGS